MPKGPEVTVSRDYLRTLEKKVEDLKTLIEVSTIISSTLDFNELMKLVMEKAKKIMDAEACSILFYNKDTNRLEFELALCREEETSEKLKDKISLEMGQGIAGWVAEKQKPLLVKDAATDSRFYKNADKLTGFTTKSLIAAPLIGRGGLIGVAEILNPRNKDSFDDYDVELFQTHCSQIAIAIENALFHKESIGRERLRQELEIAAVVQKSFLPEPPTFKKGSIKASAVNISAKKVGGDIYDFIKHIDGKVGVLIGDVSGKGVSAALYMAKILSEFRYIARMNSTPDETLKNLNSQLLGAPRGMFLTAMYAIIDTVTGEMNVANAGHPPFLWITQEEVKVMTVDSGPPLGIMAVEYPSTSIQLEKGDRLLLLTDGAFDAKNKKGERLSFDKIVEFVEKHMAEKQLIKKLIDHVNDFSQGTDRADDLTLVEINRV
ncbi:MAG TPA: GAF domain-containing protein [Nitrospirae bacterium]|nr:phosphoserine phosphatase RsbU [bacterium BMS3Abin10]GBE38274.1 phosphoserine phosphatase RsbU [bacterium BMS3Bbin08]HDH50888.1 GAF domain-containing protein [Nitrospirota bacterium]HDK41544.1 GAF domain-containing protein [Nitrospirota bacterium]HDK82681.1 GAF domain-containing protein [Nitrospirota bacterium]